MEHFSTLILDFDGTIADSVEGIVSTSMSTLKELSIPPVSREEVISLIGLPLTEMFRRMSSSDDESFLTLCTDTYRRIFKERALDSITLFPGVKESLFDLHKKGISVPDDIAVAGFDSFSGYDNEQFCRALAKTAIALAEGRDAKSVTVPVKKAGADQTVLP